MKRLAIILLAVGLISCKPSFDSDKWKSDMSVRQKQADNLIESEILLNKTYDEIYQLLGDRDLDSRLKDSIENNKNFTIQYILGGCNWIDYDRLVIEFKDERSIGVYRNCE